MTFRSSWVGTVEATDPITDLEIPRMADGSSYAEAMLLVTVHREPLGSITVDLDEKGSFDAAELADRISDAFGARIQGHLAGDGLSGDRAEAEAVCWRGVGEDAPFISVVICSRDRPGQLSEALAALVELDYEEFEIVVVDNAPSTSDTATMIQHQFGSDARVRYVLEPRPGLSRARNCGVGVARGTVVAFTDDDIRVPRWWLRALARGFTRGSGVVCVTGLVHPGSIESASQAQFEQAVACAAKWGLDPRLYDLEEHRPASPLFPYQVGVYGGGGNSAFDADFLRSIGGFDEALGAGTLAAGGEDLDAFLAVVSSGHQLAYEPSALVWHLHQTDERAVRRQTFRYGVGLGAFLAKIASQPAHLVRMLARLPIGLRYLLSPTSDKNAQKGADYPLSLTIIELLGVAWGPVAYVRSRRRAGLSGHPAPPLLHRCGHTLAPATPPPVPAGPTGGRS